MSELLPVEQALGTIVEGVTPLPAEEVPLPDSLDRVLAADVAARRTQPPWDTSAMDGYAVRSADVATLPARLRLVGESRAGARFEGVVGPGEAARIFTGAPMPEGADAVVMQEDTERDGDTVRVREASPAGRFVRPRGLDFREGEILLSEGRRLGPRDIAIAAAMNHPVLPVRRRPLVVLISTGDELVPPGGELGPDQIVASNAYGIAAALRRAGAEPLDLGIVPDTEAATRDALRRARESGAEIIVTVGGASVGDHDLVRAGFESEGARLDFWKIAMRPGKPLMFGHMGPQRVVGLPGNPVSAMVCTQVFLLPLVAAFLGTPGAAAEEDAVLAEGVKANDRRREYMRARFVATPEGMRVAPHERQDSSMLATFHRSDCLLVREAFAPAADAGEPCRILRLDR